jgi:hypothetical protein
MTDALLNDSCSLNPRFTDFIAIYGLYNLETRLINCQRVGVYGCLRNKAVWKRKTDDAGDKASATEEEEVPVETGRLLKGVLSRLCGKRRHVL